MPWLFIVVAIAWVVISAVGSKKKQQARAEAEQQAARQRQQAEPAQPQPAAPFSPYFPDVPRSAPQPARPAQQPAHPIQPQPQAVRQPAPASRMQTGPGSTLTEIQQTQRHTLQPSERAGHAHQETSMSGFEPDCPPDNKPSVEPRPGDRAAYAGMPAFSWQTNAVLNGLVYAEILGKPKALRG